MRKHPSLWLLFAVWAAIAGYAAWVFHQAATPDAGRAALRHAWPFLLAGVVIVAAAIGVFVWLAVYSDKHGYDARAGRDEN